MWLLLACAHPDGDTTEAPAFVVTPADVGAPLAARVGFDPADGDALGLAFAHALPVFGENPAWDTPTGALALWDPDTVRDPAACPREEVDGDARRWIGGCRSSQGYEFEGEASLRSWNDGVSDRVRWEGDLEVWSDRDDPLFDRVRVVGAFEQATPMAGSVTQHLDVNVHVEVEGYWETRAPGDPIAQAWADWTVSGSLERRDTWWVTELAADVGGSGGFAFDAPGLDADPSCPIEVVGDGTLADGVAAVFDGVQGCDACASVGDVRACAP